MSDEVVPIKRFRTQVPDGHRGSLDTRLLWLFEGVTSYYDDLALLRCGLLSRTQYLETLARSLTTLRRTPGDARQSLAESSFDAWIKYYRQDENSPNAQTSYYLKGSLVALPPIGT